jgi:hypothetical protein
MSDDQFMRLFKYVQEMRAEMNEKFDNMATKEDISELYAVLDRHAAMLEDLTAAETTGTTRSSNCKTA